MKRTTLAAARRRASSRIASRNHRRALRFELLERRELLAVGLAGVQAVDLWQMALDINHTTNQGEILSQTAANFTLTGSSQQAGQNVSVDWGDHSAVYQGTFNSGPRRPTTHTFSSGAFTVTVTCGADVTHYRLQSSAIALGQVAGAPSPTDSLFIVGNDGAKQVYANDGRAERCKSASRILTACGRISSRSVAAIYGSLAGSNDVVTLCRQRDAAGVLLAGRRQRLFRRRRRPATPCWAATATT